TGKILHTARGAHAALDPRGRLLALAGSSIRLVRLTDGKEIESLSPQMQVDGLTISPDGSRLAVAGRGVRVWDLERKKWNLFGSTREFWTGSLSFSGDGQRLAAAVRWRSPAKGAILVWEVKNGREVASLDLGSLLPTSVAFSPD